VGWKGKRLEKGRYGAACTLARDGRRASRGSKNGVQELPNCLYESMSIFVSLARLVLIVLLSWERMHTIS
jgi:hypothetical protein